MKFKVGDVISNGRLYRRVKALSSNPKRGVLEYELIPLRDASDNRDSFALTSRYVELEYYLHTKLHELLLGLDSENETLYNGEKEQT